MCDFLLTNTYVVSQCLESTGYNAYADPNLTQIYYVRMGYEYARPSPSDIEKYCILNLKVLSLIFNLLVEMKIANI